MSPDSIKCTFKFYEIQKNFFFLFNKNLLRNSMTNILSVVQQAFLNPVCTSLINSNSSAKVFSQISLESINYDRISDASSDDTIESACITIALCNKDSNTTTHFSNALLTSWRLKHGNKLQRRKEDI